MLEILAACLRSRPIVARAKCTLNALLTIWFKSLAWRREKRGEKRKRGEEKGERRGGEKRRGREEKGERREGGEKTYTL